MFLPSKTILGYAEKIYFNDILITYLNFYDLNNLL